MEGEKGEDNGERSRMVQVDSLLCFFIYLFFLSSFLLTIHPFTHLFSVVIISAVCVCVCVCGCSAYFILHLICLWLFVLVVGESVGHGGQI